MDPRVIEQVASLANSYAGCNMHASIPCTPWSQWQHMATAKLGEVYIAELAQRRAQSLVMLKHCFIIARIVIANGGHFSFEWPRYCSGWLRPELLGFMIEFDLLTASFDGCDLGLVDNSGFAIKKPWRITTTSKSLAYNLGAHLCRHPKGHQRSIAEGSKTAKTAFYPPAMCQCIIQSLLQRCH
jgi:hypothetical protein